MEEYLIQNANIIGHDVCFEHTDLLIAEKKIAAIAKGMTPKQGQKVIDAEGKYLLPGLIDMHCHLREPGYEYKEDIESGTRAALKGGFTSVCCMPNTNPVVDNEGTLLLIQKKAEEAGYARVYPICAVTKGLKGEELTEMGRLQKAGAVAFSDDGRPVERSSMMKNALRYAKGFDALIISHCEDYGLVDGGVMNESKNSALFGLAPNTRAAEEVMIAREIILAQTYDTKVHIAHVSTRYGVQMIRDAKARGVRVTCETCPHYFALTDDAIEGFNTYAKVNPPLREKEDVEAIILGLQDGTIDCIVTDHAPHHKDEKDCEFDQAANGISGFETALSLCYEKLVEPGYLSMMQLMEKMCYNPARILGLPYTKIQQGSMADLILFDHQSRWKVGEDTLVSKGKNTPFTGQTMHGEVVMAFVDGKRCYKAR